MSKKINFYAGPSLLDSTILHKAIELIKNDNGPSMLEISHRSRTVQDLFRETKILIKEIMDLDENKEVLFLHGGASLQFAMVALNIETKKKAGFVDTGIWSKKAIVESRKIRETEVLGSSERDRYRYIPKNLNFPDNLGYLHLTSNNTIYGTQYHQFPETEIPMVIDMSSDILSRRLDFNKYDLIFAGFQKNLGTSGGCLVILDKRIIDCNDDNIPSMLSYNTHIKAESMFNTPPVFPVLMCNLTLKWIKEQGGLDEIEKRNIEKSNLLYSEIDRNALFQCPIKEEDRSMMNICFEAINGEIENQFLLLCDKNNIIGIKGHRVKGGFRASLYNSMKIADVQFLVDLMKAFELKTQRRHII